MQHTELEALLHDMSLKEKIGQLFEIVFPSGVLCKESPLYKVFSRRVL